MKASGHPTVCFLTGTLNAFAGAERMTAVIANALAERGYRVLILSLWDRATVFPLHPEIVHDAVFNARPSFKRHYLATVAGIRRVVRRHDVDVLVEVDTMLTLFTLPATLGLGVRRIAWEHCHFDEDLGRRARRVARWVAARTGDTVVVLTERDKLRWRNGHPSRDKIQVIPNPLPFPFPIRPASLESQTVLAVGRLVPEKGFDVLISAWALVSSRFPGWKLTIVGEGEARPTLEAQIRSQGLGASVSLPGATNQIEEHYQRASVFCLSSWYEGFGLVLVEAMSYGLPIISTDCETGPRELIDAGTNGFLVPTGNPIALADTLAALLANRPLRQDLGNKARQYARRFDANQISARWRTLVDPSCP